MPTPAYTPQDSAHLTASTVGTDVPEFSQADINALADEAALLGMLGWSQTYTYTGSDITQIVAARGVYRVRVDITYHVAGPATGKVDTMTHRWSNDSGATWALRTDTTNGVTAGVLTMNYDGSGNVTSPTWS